MLKESNSEFLKMLYSDLIERSAVKWLEDSHRGQGSFDLMSVKDTIYHERIIE